MPKKESLAWDGITFGLTYQEEMLYLLRKTKSSAPAFLPSPEEIELEKDLIFAENADKKSTGEEREKSTRTCRRGPKAYKLHVGNRNGSLSDS